MTYLTRIPSYWITIRNSLRASLALVTLFGAALASARAAENPRLGESAPAFALTELGGETVSLADVSAKGNVVLVVLRGWPGYQCPICDRQVNELVGARADFAKAHAQLVLVYPGPAADLKAHAVEFETMKGREWPAEYRLLLDPDFTLVDAYGLRWDAPNETAYPSTFIVDARGVIRFAKISHGHGDRASAREILGALRKIPAPQP